jgi:hypothetical protein
VTAADVLANVRVFLAQGDDWRDDAEPLLADYRRGAIRELPEGTGALAHAVRYEVEACDLAAAGRWADATRVAQEAARELGSGEDATRSYRALWLYLAAVWADQAGEEAGDTALRSTARALIRQAEQAAKPTTWTRELAPLPGAEPEPLTPADAAAVTAIASKLQSGVSKTKHDQAVTAMLNGLKETDPGQYEPALTALGILLGATASKPAGKGRCDSVWRWQDELWLAMEAKSDHKPTGLIPHKDIRQANDQLRLLAADRDRPVPPADSATIVVSPKPAVNSDGIKSAEAHVHVTQPEVVSDLAHDAVDAWADILAGRAGQTLDSLRVMISAAFLRHSVLPTQVRDRLTQQPVAS